MVVVPERAAVPSMVDADTAHTQGKSVCLCQYGCNGPELKADTLVDRQPVQLMP